MNVFEIEQYNNIIVSRNGIITGINDNIIIKHDDERKTWIKLFKDSHTLEISNNGSIITLILTKLTTFGYHNKVSDICIAPDGSKIAFTVNDLNDHFVGNCILSRHDEEKDIWVEDQFLKDETPSIKTAKNICFSDDGKGILVSLSEEDKEYIAGFNHNGTVYELKAVIAQEHILNNINENNKFRIEAISSYNNNIQVVYTIESLDDIYRYYFFCEINVQNNEVDKYVKFIDKFPADLQTFILIEPEHIVRFIPCNVYHDAADFQQNLRRIVVRTNFYYLDKSSVSEDKFADSVSTDKIKQSEEKDKMVRRHHLIIQHMLNNIAIQIKENQPVNFEMKSLEITEERIKITGFKYNNNK